MKLIPYRFFSFTVLLLCGVMLIWHFAMTFVYVAPSGIFPASWYPLVVSYMNPGFYQGWSLFAPDVSSWQNELYYRTFSDGEWSDWQETTSMEGRSAHPKLEEIPEKLNHNLSVQLRDNLYYKDSVPRFDRVIIQKQYHSAAHYCRMHHFRMTNSEADSIQLRLDFSFFPKPGSSETEEPRSFMYPPHSLEHVNNR